MTACRSRWSLRVRAPRGVTRVKVYIDGRLVRSIRGRAAKVPSVAGVRRHRATLVDYRRRHVVRRIRRHVYGCARARR